MDDVARYFALSEKSFEAALEVLAMRAQNFRDIVDHGIEEERHTAFLVEQGHDAVYCYSYKTARIYVTGRLETEAAKQLAKLRIEKATNQKKGAAARVALTSPINGKGEPFGLNVFEEFSFLAECIFENRCLPLTLEDI